MKRCLVQNDNALSWKKITKSISLKPYNDAEKAAPVVEASVAEEPSSTVNEIETAEKETLADTKNKFENYSLEDLLEKDDVDIFGKEDNNINIYNDFFKEDK